MQPNIISCFKAFGMVPLETKKVLLKIPEANKYENVETFWTDSFIVLLKRFRGNDNENEK